jgi:hypothetical protein
MVRASAGSETARQTSDRAAPPGGSVFLRLYLWVAFVCTRDLHFKEPGKSRSFASLRMTTFDFFENNFQSSE